MVSWLAAGGRGAPVAAAEAIAGAHFPGLEFNGVPAPSAGDNERRRQANRDKRAARMQDQREELQQLKAVKKSEPGEVQQRKGGGKGKTKDQSGLQLCFSWSSGTGPCEWRLQMPSESNPQVPVLPLAVSPS